ncbi:MAG: D-aminoacyl-tRNA deacylase [Alkalilacustris sp.]
MRALVQRVSEAAVSVEGHEIARIGSGLVVLVCAMAGDGPAEAEAMAGRIARLRILRDDAGRMNRALLDTGGAALVVSQFTLAADTRRGNRPGFSDAAPPELAADLVERCAMALSDLGVPVAQGRFGAEMAVRLVNDGPVTLWLDLPPKER